MNDISIAFAASFGSRGTQDKYLPMINMLGDKCYRFYGISFPRGYRITNEPVDKLELTKITDVTSRHLVGPICKLIKKPDYYTYLSNQFMFDRITRKKVAGDPSEIVYASPLLTGVVTMAKEAGKMVVVEAGNSEPQREYDRITTEYDLYDIKHKYIYGNPIYKKTVMKSFSMADKIVSISKLSLKTYLDAGYNPDKFELIPLTGSNFVIQSNPDQACKKRCFITTGYHSFIKGTHRLLLAWKKAAIKNIPLLIVGDICEDLKEFAERYGPFENVIFEGHKNNLDKYYQQMAAVGVLLSLSEGAARVVPEMMSYGFPMIVSSDATCDLVRNGVNGMIVDPLNVDEVADALLYYANNWDNVYDSFDAVVNSLNGRTSSDFSIELGKYLLSL